MPEPRGRALVGASVRGLVAAAAFAVAVEIMPNVAWSRATTTRATLVILAVVGVLNALLPPVVDRLHGVGPRRTMSVAIAALILNSALAVALFLASYFVHVGLALSGARSHPTEAALALPFVAILAALPILLELRLALAASVRPG